MKPDHETVIDRVARIKREGSPAICSICRQVLDHPELRGHMFAPKPDGPFAGKIPMSFSATLVQAAGGIESLLEHWYIGCPTCCNPASRPGSCRNPFHGERK